MSQILRRLSGLASAAAVVFGALAAAAQPIAVRSLSQWAEEDRFVSPESGSSRPGKWLNSTSPYALEPMACLDAADPSRRVIVCAAAQLLKSELFLNWAGQTISDDPAPMMLVLPSLDELRNWNNTKWQPTLDAAARAGRPWKVRDVVDRARTGSTTAFKKFPGGFLHVTTASSSKGLQSRSIKRVCCDEVSEFPADAGGRGDPLKQAETRQDAHDDAKSLHTSTPKTLPACRITNMYEAGDRRLYYVACPLCGERQHLQFDAMRGPILADLRTVFVCLACREPIDEVHKPAMLAGGRWIKTYVDRDVDDQEALANPDNPAPPDHFPEGRLEHWLARTSAGRDPSFHLWQGYSPFKAWGRLWQEYQDAKRDVATGKDPEALKVFWQQKLARAWDDASDAPDHEKLYLARGRFVQRGFVPAWACETVGVADVQGDRIEWDAYAFGPDLSCARFDWGVIDIDPLEPEAWAELGLVASRRFPGEATVDLGFDSFGVDLGGKKGVTEKVYRFVRGRHNVFALKGSSDADAVPLVRGKRRIIRLRDGGTLTLEPYLVGGWGLKSAVYGALQVSLLADKARLPGGLYNPVDATHDDFKGYASEVFRQPKTMRAGARGWWERIGGQANERLDLAVYARALAWSRGVYKRTPAEWQALFASRARTPESTMPLFAAAEAPPAIPQAETAPNPGNVKRDFFGARKGL